MIIKELTVGLVATCCYVISSDTSPSCVVIDPGGEADRILRAADGRPIDAILLTHGHFDHIGAVEKLMSPGTQLLIHCLDAPMLGDPDLNASLALLDRSVTAPDPTGFVSDGDLLSLAGLDIQVIHTPGHTPGSVCYLAGNHLFTGDTLFDHGWGRTDLPGGSQRDLFASLRRLMPLAEDHSVHAGHHT